ncbi:HTH-type transcriptional activator TipA [Microtetraspora sp. NBRC 13810]|uniref:MerR family transcriptional regulator n=1 Tax=Microtetraspora sp. NBRC 13810 TaxID=3030990 RepID=UPI0024A10D6C|nr:MerR family transcriptional regulator [Microtetraspora sp. NBRC 13810]GLW06908.1 HTH-type transcriptional activator TipA [Microtetraspora sp. NBRC 13810]
MGIAVGEVSRLAGVTVRTLHHYDDIGLVRPSERTRSGYRSYTEPDVERLQQVLFYRELGFPLEEIAAILADPGADRMTHLRRQRELLRERIGRLEAMAAAVERAMEAYTMDIRLTAQERLEVFGDFRPEEHEREARERWGDTEAYRQSSERMARMTKADWVRFRAEAEATTEAFALAYTGGLAADSARAMELAEEHRAHLVRWCYDCSYELHRGLGDMYADDPRFAANFEPLAEGLSRYIRDAIHANADRAGGGTGGGAL